MSLWKRLGNLARGKLKVMRTGGSGSLTPEEREALQKELTELEAQAKVLETGGATDETREIRKEIERLRAEAEAPEEAPVAGDERAEPAARGKKRDLWPAEDERDDDPERPDKGTRKRRL